MAATQPSTTPPGQEIAPLSSRFSSFDPTMSPGLAVAVDDLANPFGYGGPLSSSITVQSPTADTKMSNSRDAEKDDDEKEDEVKMSSTSDNSPQFKKRKDDSPGGGAGSSANNLSTTHNGTKESTTGTDTDTDSDVNMSGTQTTNEAADADDDIQFIASTPIKAKSITLIRSQLVVPSVETDLMAKMNKQFAIGEPSETPLFTLPNRIKSAPPGPQRLPKFDFVYRINVNVLPPQGTPLFLELTAFVQRWSVWATHMAPGKARNKVIQSISEVLQKTWQQGIESGDIPRRVPVGCEALSNEDLAEVYEASRDREALEELHKKKSDAAKVVKIEVQRWIESDYTKYKTKKTIGPPPNYSITAGELAEAGVKWSNVEARLARDDVDEENELLHRIMEGESIVPSQHWRGIRTKTSNNPLGRDLLMYCLWECCRCEAQVASLQDLVDNSKGPERIVGQASLDGQNELRDQLMAIALELDPDKESYSISSDDDSESGDVHDTKETRVRQSTDSSLEIMPTQTRASKPIPYRQSYTEKEIPMLTSSSTSPQAYFKLRDFIATEIRPRANELLKGSAPPLEEHVMSWSPIADALKTANVPLEQRNELVVRVNMSVQQIDAELQLRQDDVSGYPSQLEIWQMIPPHGLTSQELQQVFPNIPPTDRIWHKLVLAVAFLRDSRWFPKEESTMSPKLEPLPAGFGPSKVLHMKTTAHFDPAEFSSRIVNNTQGFRWRYTNTSTLAQRKSMDDIVGSYVMNTIASDRAYVQATGHKTVLPRSGRYEILVHPDNPDGGEIVHGLWDATKGRRVSDAEWQWFYDGEEKDVTMSHGYKSYDPIGEGDAVGSGGEGGGSGVAAPVVAAAPVLPAPVPVSLPKGKTIKGKGKAKASGGKKRKSPGDHEDSPRPKRNAGKSSPSYVEDGE